MMINAEFDTFADRIEMRLIQVLHEISIRYHICCCIVALVGPYWLELISHDFIVEKSFLVGI